MGASAAEYRQIYKDISSSVAIGAADGDTTLVVGVANHTIFIQSIIVWISTDAAQSWSFEDSNGTPLQIFEVTTSPGDSTRWGGHLLFGEKGVALTEGKNFVLNVSAAGLAGVIVWEGYLAPSSTRAA